MFLTVVSKLDHSTVYLEGSTITLQVHVPGSSSASSSSETLQYTWRRDGRVLSDSSASHSISPSLLPDGGSIYGLNVSDVRGKDSGVYSCELSNDISTKMVTFDYVGVVSVAISSSLNILSGGAVKEGNNISLQCVAEFTNVPSSSDSLEVSVMWARSGRSPLGNHVITFGSTAVMSSEASHRMYRSGLMFSPAMRGDGGRYVCTVSYRLTTGSEVRVHHHDNILDIESELVN